MKLDRHAATYNISTQLHKKLNKGAYFNALGLGMPS